MKEAHTVCRILAQLTRLLRLDPASLNAHGASIKAVCQQHKIECPALGKAVVSLYVQVLLFTVQNDGMPIPIFD